MYNNIAFVNYVRTLLLANENTKTIQKRKKTKEIILYCLLAGQSYQDKERGVYAIHRVSGEHYQRLLLASLWAHRARPLRDGQYARISKSPKPCQSRTPLNRFNCDTLF